MTENEILVSVICNTYNHEKYIEKALRGFVSQKTNFRYEVSVHDDASSDSTRSIIEKYQKKYPDIIKPVFEEKNQFNNGIDYIVDIHLPRIKGKYVAFCEGDDYWTDTSKLQKQYEFMESNNDCILCVHKAIKVNEKGEGKEDYADYSKIGNGTVLLNSDYIIRHMELFPFNSMFFYRDFLIKHQAILHEVKGYDYVYKVLLASEGNVYMIDNYMSAYRTSAIGSWSERVNRKADALIKHLQESIYALSKINDYEKLDDDSSIKREILYREYRILLLSKNYRMATKKKFRPIRKELGWKHNIKVHLMSYICL